ncbi:MAG: twin-arginine translocase TatA/TatE family subunit [Halobacteriota archaeon]
MVTETILPIFIGALGPVELGVIFLIAVLLFGANKIPQLARSTGQAMGEFKKGREEVEEELKEMQEGSLESDADTEPVGDESGTVSSVDDEEAEVDRSAEEV